MPIRTLSMIVLTVYFDWIKEKAVWNGENVQLKDSFIYVTFIAQSSFPSASRNELTQTTAILYASLIVCILSSLTVMHQLKPHWFDKIPKWEIGTTTLAFAESANQRV